MAAYGNLVLTLILGRVLRGERMTWACVEALFHEGECFPFVEMSDFRGLTREMTGWPDIEILS